MIASQVPILGVGLVMAPCVLYLFATGQTYEAIGLLIWGTTAVGLVDNILGPLLIKGQTNMNGLLILISVLGGIQLFGPIGLIMGPTILAAIMVMLELYKNGILDNKSTVLIR